jgi:uncharacterized DUF497 family protein
MQDDEFEWDERKAAANLRRHRVSFKAARRTFDDPFAIARADRREDYGEARYVITGMVGDRLLFVAYTMREGRIRIIMARYAEPFERKLYHEENTKD